MWNVTMNDTTKLTLELRDLVENGVDIWNFEYPSFYTGDEKKAFEQKVIDHYYFRQIGQETTGRFLHYFRSKIREIMPYYIKLYESVKLMDDVGDPFEAYNLTEIMKRDGIDTVTHGFDQTITNTITDTMTRESDQQSTNSKTEMVKHSDTPQGVVNDIGSHMSDATQSNGEDDNITHALDSTQRNGLDTNKISGTNFDTSEFGSGYTLTRRGNIGVQPLGVEINYYRSALINVDTMIIDELNDLFLKIY